MFMKEDMGDALVMFKEDPETGDITDEVEMFLIAMGEVMTPIGLVILARDKDGFEWSIKRSDISMRCDAPYSWVKNCIERMMNGFSEKGRK